MVESVERAPIWSLVPPDWVMRSGFELPATPWDLRAQRWVCVGRVVDNASARSALAAVARGTGLVATVELLGHEHRRFLEDLGRAAPGETPAPARAITRGHVALLELLASGESVAAAADRLHISRRTAHRWLTAARQELDVATTAEAVQRRSAFRVGPTVPPFNARSS